MSANIRQPLSGAVALVTGAQRGIGRAICAALCEAGACVVATDIEDRPEDLKVDGWFRHDVTSSNDWSFVLGEIQRQFGRLDCLVNNAGILVIERFEDTTLAAWRRVMSVNVESVVLGMQIALPLLRQSGIGRPGGSAVVNISSTGGVRGGRFGTAYCASKAAVTLLSKSAAQEFSALRYPIRVNSIHPGAVETRMMESVLKRLAELGVGTSTEDQKAVWSAKGSFGRIAMPEEIASGVVFLCSSAASFVNGSELVIDGGTGT